MSLPVPLKMTLRWTRRVLVAVDQLGNAVLGGLPTQTMSYRAALARRNGSEFACLFCRFLDLFQRDHCSISLGETDTNKLIVPLPRV